MDWFGVASVGGIWAGSLGGLLLYLHTRNVKASEEDRAQHRERAEVVNHRFGRLEEQLSKFDSDMDGLTRQLAADRTDAERRFLTKMEHDAAIGRLDGNVVRLADTIDKLRSDFMNVALKRSGGDR